MSLKKIDQVREGKLFRVWDILVYALVIVVSVVLIVVFTFTRDNTPLSGVIISYKGQTVFTYDFQNNKYEITSAEHITVVEDEADRLLVRFTCDEGFNDIEFDLDAVSVKVVDTDCSVHKDCLYSTPLTVNGSIPILCQPHGLVIRPLVVVDDGNIIV